MNTLIELFDSCQDNLKTQFSAMDFVNVTLDELFTQMLSALEDPVIKPYKQELTTNGEMAAFQSYALALKQMIVEVVKPLTFAVQEQETIEQPHTPVKINTQKSRINYNQLIESPKVNVVGGGALGVLAGAFPNFITIPLLGAAILFSVLHHPDKIQPEIVEHPKQKRDNIDLMTNNMITICRQYCEQLDNLMKIYRSYLSVEKPIEEKKTTLRTSYSTLLERMNSLFVAKYNQEDELNACQKVFKTLENLGYKFIPYSEENKQYFKIVESPHIDSPIMTEAPLFENGECIQMGEYLIPISK